MNCACRWLTIVICVLIAFQMAICANNGDVGWFFCFMITGILFLFFKTMICEIFLDSKHRGDNDGGGMDM